MRGMRKNTAAPQMRIISIKAGCNPRERKCQTAVLLRIVGMPRLDIRRVSGTPHFHQHERGNRHQHERGEREQEDAVDRQHCRCQHHQKGEDRQRDVIALAPQREHAHHHAEQCQVHGGGQKLREKTK